MNRRQLISGTLTLVAAAAMLSGTTSGTTALAATAGSPPRPADLAEIRTFSFTPAADAYVDGQSPTENFELSRLAVSSERNRIAYVRFSVSGLPSSVVRARLLFHVWAADFAGSRDVTVVHYVANTSWLESTLTYANRPPVSGPPLSQIVSVTPDGWREVDVTSVVSGNGRVGFALSSSGPDGAYYDSREQGVYAPLLVIDVDVAATGSHLLAAGDIADCNSVGDTATANIMNGLSGLVAPLGDLAYQSGTQSQFTDCYAPTWGRYKSRTRPTPGNHDYVTTGASEYFGYFGAAASNPAKGYYSYSLGAWHIVVLNSNCGKIPGGCAAGGAQERWLRADLAAHPVACTLAYWHHPLFTSSSVHPGLGSVRPLFQALYDAGAEIVLNGHNHQYERFAPQTPTGAADPARGIREWVVGTGGESHYSFGSIMPNSEVRDAVTFGILDLTLRPTSYSWQFRPIAGKTFTDSGTGSCH